MDKTRRLIIAGNWKSNKTNSEAVALVSELIRDLANVKELDIVVCPPFTALSDVSRLVLESNIRLGAQNLSDAGYGAFTGEIAPGMLRELSVRYVILGHSERRQFQKETDAQVARKAANAHSNNLIPIVCFGETLAEREAGITEQIVETQVRGSLAGLSVEQMEMTVLAYEPVWAIGTGKTASSAQAQEVHAFVRQVLTSLYGESVSRRVRIQYGGSVKGSNARELLGQPDIDGALVGGASLDSKNFVEIIKNSI
ncbi:MAG: triose-phosphate isomerase [Pedosphaera sp.]|nr:triose-phosphate isomerase [Pedosphaera sp.]